MFIEKFFRLGEMETTFSREVAGGAAAFLAMAHILALVPGILCVTGMSFTSAFSATALSTAAATLAMALLANLPVALAPGIGLCVFFSYSVVLGMGCSWRLALSAVFAEGIIFLLLSACGAREAIVRAIPPNMRRAIASGTGLFITLAGLSNAGIAARGGGAILAFEPLGMTHPSALVAALGLGLLLALYVRRVPGAILISVVATTAIGIPLGVTVVPSAFSAAAFPSAPYIAQFQLSGVLSLKFISALLVFLFSDVFDTVGALVGVSEQAGLQDGKGGIRNGRRAMLSDAAGTVIGSCLGVPAVTSSVESAAAAACGARTGLSSAVTSMLFFASLFFGPLFSLVPLAASAPALILVGFLMARSAGGIDFSDPTEGIPCFVAMAAIPFSCSISTGIAWGMVSYALCKVAAGRAKELGAATAALAVLLLLGMAFGALS